MLNQKFDFKPEKWFLWMAGVFLITQTIFTWFFNLPTVSIPNHDTYFVVSNSWILMSLSAFMAFIALIYFTFGKMSLPLHRGLNQVHFFTTVGSILILAFGLHISGFFTKSENSNAQAVLFDYTLLKKFISLAGFLLLFAQVVFVFNCLFSIARRRKL